MTNANASLDQSAKPGLKIVGDVIVEVTPVDMQHVERTVGRSRPAHHRKSNELGSRVRNTLRASAR